MIIYKNKTTKKTKKTLFAS